ncbi:hypothetical protein BUALT_Bualt19G0049900 [Buddleja alternifolia]|uniref:Glutaredoxin domain-containing protein n=1 Tax=Buddleja alternifolia TaxID=168488 RepID=A0AAV6W5D8_9LAMI|nr:hypothetical protein BUALT_Bualt19G0049900 [Buddleja alternifolia]
MADSKNHGLEKNPNYNIKKNSASSVFNRSMTINSSAAAVGEIANKPLYNNIYNTPTFQRNGSIKSSLYTSTSSFGSLVSASNSFKGKVKKLCSIFESPKQPPSSITPSPDSTSNFIPNNVPDSPFTLPGTEDRVVIYFTSLRGIRRTFQDCHSVRMIFRGFRVNLDERDISMDIAYRKEIQKLLGGNNVTLPQVFIRGKYIGGADVVKHLLEVGELARLLKGLPLCPPKPCDACDDVRFYPCTNCNGSRKVFDEDEEQPKRCPECNENGLVRCPLCCS